MDVAQAVKATMEEVLRNTRVEMPDELKGAMLLSDLDIDSMEWATVIVMLEEKLGVDPFDTQEDYDLPTTVQDFIDFYRRSVGVAGTPTDAS